MGRWTLGRAGESENRVANGGRSVHGDAQNLQEPVPRNPDGDHVVLRLAERRQRQAAAGFIPTAGVLPYRTSF